jgi:hypothetical protein
MFLSKETQDKITPCVKSKSKSQNSNMATIYSSPPNSPPQTKLSPSEPWREPENDLCPSKAVSSIPITPPTSPHPHPPRFVPKDEKSAEDIKHEHASTLRSRLCLDNGKCGGATKDGTPCRNLTPKGNRDQVKSKVESMITFTQCSPELERELDELGLACALSTA